MKISFLYEKQRNLRSYLHIIQQTIWSGEILVPALLIKTCLGSTFSSNKKELLCFCFSHKFSCNNLQKKCKKNFVS